MNKLSVGTIALSFTILFGAIACFSQSTHLFSVEKNDSMIAKCCRIGFIDGSGEIKIDFKFYYITPFSEGLSAVLLTKGGKWAYIDETGNMVIAPQFDEATPFSNGLAKVVKNGETFFITKNGRKAFDTSFTLLGFREELSPAKFSENWGFVNIEGKVVIPFKFQNANPFYENLAAVTQNNRIGYIDKLGNWAIFPRFSPMSSYSDQLFLPNFSEGLAVFRDEDKYGFIDKNGSIVISAIYDRAESFSEELALVKLNGKIGYLKKDGQFAIQPTFESGEKFSNGLAAVRIDGKWGYIDKFGKLQISAQYDSAENFKNELAKVSKYDEKDRTIVTGYICKKGELIYFWER